MNDEVFFKMIGSFRLNDFFLQNGNQKMENKQFHFIFITFFQIAYFGFFQLSHSFQYHPQSISLYHIIDVYSFFPIPFYFYSTFFTDHKFFLSFLYNPSRFNKLLMIHTESRYFLFLSLYLINFFFI